MAGIAPGSYTISAALRDKQTLSALQLLDVGPDGADNVVLTLAEGSEVKGQLRFEGPPPPHVTELTVDLALKDQTPGMFFSTPSGHVNADLSFTLDHVNAEIYRVEISGLPDGYYLKSVRAGDDELKESRVDATKGAPGPLVITVSAKAGQIEGIVLNAKEQPSAGVAVVLVPEPKLRDRDPAFKQTTSDQYGRFLIKTIEPGDYKLFAWEDVEPGEYRDPEFLKPFEDRGREIHIREGSRESADLKLIPAAAPAPKPRKPSK